MTFGGEGVIGHDTSKLYCHYEVSGGWGSLCTFVRTYVVLLMVESKIVLFRPLCEVLDSVPSLHIQWYSCCFSHCVLCLVLLLVLGLGCAW